MAAQGIPSAPSRVGYVEAEATPASANMPYDAVPPPELIIIDALGNRVSAVPPQEDDEPAGDEPVIRVEKPDPTK